MKSDTEEERRDAKRNLALRGLIGVAKGSMVAATVTKNITNSTTAALKGSESGYVPLRGTVDVKEGASFIKTSESQTEVWCQSQQEC